MTNQETAEVVNGSCSKSFYSNLYDCESINESSKNGLSWNIQYLTELASFDSFNKISRCVYVMCKFEWDEAELKEQGYDGYEGEVVVVYRNQINQDILRSVRIPYKMQLIHSGKEIRRRIATGDEAFNADYHRFELEFSLKKFCFESKSVASNFNDAVLIVEGRKINVNKTYLSMHSEYFDKLFNSEFKEKSMSEIPIDDVKYTDFSQLLGTIHPTHPVFPTEETMEILLDLADRFMLPVVVERVLNHLRYSSDLPFEDFLSITDKYNMEEFWKLGLNLIDSKKKMKLLIENINYEGLSETAKVKIFSHFATIIKRYDFAN